MLLTRTHAARRLVRGFTLVEMLVVLGIIFLILAIAVPSFSALSGSRSVEAGENVAAAAISRARAEAIRRGVTVGALFYPDVEGRTAIAFVAIGEATGDDDPYSEYASLVTNPDADYGGFLLNPPGANTVMLADTFKALASDENPIAYSGNLIGFAGRPIVMTYSVRSEGDALTSPGLEDVGPSVNVNDSGFVDVIGNTNNPSTYADVGPNSIISPGRTPSNELVLLSDVAGDRLPVGVGVQIITGQALEAGAANSGRDGAMVVDAATAFGGTAAGYEESFIDRYVRFGMIAFDSDGRLATPSFNIRPNDALATLLGLNAAASQTSLANSSLNVAGSFPAFTAGVGVIVYRNEAFERAPADETATEWQGSFFSSVDAPSISWVASTESDPSSYFPDFDVQAAGDPFVNTGELLDNEYAEERWLDANTTPLLVNRYSGTLSSNLGEQP